MQHLLFNTIALSLIFLLLNIEACSVDSPEKEISRVNSDPKLNYTFKDDSLLIRLKIRPAIYFESLDKLNNNSRQVYHASINVLVQDLRNIRKGDIGLGYARNLNATKTTLFNLNCDGKIEALDQLILESSQPQMIHDSYLISLHKFIDKACQRLTFKIKQNIYSNEQINIPLDDNLINYLKNY